MAEDAAPAWRNPDIGAVLVTGAAGFIGFHVARRLCRDGARVVGIDNLTPYYDPALKRARLAELAELPNFAFHELDITDAGRVAGLVRDEAIGQVVHLAAQPGVRHSLTHPFDYTKANIEGFLSILEACRHNGVGHLVYASSSSVYGTQARQPFDEHAPSVHPISLYAATKRANELMAHTYSHLYALPTTGLRFFTVYGPWGRPDMAPFKFTRAILAGEPIELYNFGEMSRDFTYVDDVVEGVVRILARPPQPDPHWNPVDPDPATSAAPWRVYNIGNDSAVGLWDFVRAIEAATGREAAVELKPMQPGDVRSTLASVDDLREAVGFRPDTPIREGVKRFVDWYVDYYGR
ncbi:NAD-dependent epimerase [Propylenella binzhouense]|uniref:NAD-dependent epimerase n=1 Tax=Propylenella binzhouense TaxID=2555902 RepID=A0A964T5A7_9HYPH|nr:NAD-dependent epimerase [Propylenella binzhouense]MYZ47742.1 NAD-dependent epimerase [Propylenella binzhouense]